jgi:hypothetical protein
MVISTELSRLAIHHADRYILKHIPTSFILLFKLDSYPFSNIFLVDCLVFFRLSTEFFVISICRILHKTLSVSTFYLNTRLTLCIIYLWLEEKQGIDSSYDDYEHIKQ